MEMSSMFGIINAGKEIIAVLKEFKSMFPDNDKAKDLMLRLEFAESQLQEQQALTAKELGFLLCQCTYPPQIMLYQHQKSVFSCHACGYATKNLPVAAGNYDRL